MLAAMKHVATIAGILLGALFLFASIAYFFEIDMGQEPPEPGSAAAHFWMAFGATGYMNFVKACELLGAVLVMIPPSRAIGLLLLGPIVANIAAYHVYVAQDSLLQPMLLATFVLTFVLLVCELPRLTRLLNPLRPKSR